MAGERPVLVLAQQQPPLLPVGVGGHAAAEFLAHPPLHEAPVGLDPVGRVALALTISPLEMIDELVREVRRGDPSLVAVFLDPGDRALPRVAHDRVIVIFDSSWGRPRFWSFDAVSLHPLGLPS